MLRLSLKRLKLLDYLFLVLFTAAAVASFLPLRSAAGAQRVVVTGEGGRWVFPAAQKRETIHIHGPLGDTIVEVGGGGGRIVSSPCPNKDCVASGFVSSPGRTAVCLPNRVMLAVEGDNGVDGAAW